jgi:protein-S-isoprenylcysteine O-methyltransferase Ste14
MIDDALRAQAERPLGKALYGALFTIVVPLLLVAWARATATIVTVPLAASPAIGTSIAAVGIALMGAGMRALRVHGGGLPMNAYPPPRFVSRGIYALVSHPIYVGFCLASAGVAIAEGSASGLYLVTPFAALACVAIVHGYERHDLRARFGDMRPTPWLRLATDDLGAPGAAERWAAVAMVLVPWAIAYEFVARLGVSSDAFSLAPVFERRAPVIEEAEIVYASTYVVTLAAPFLARTRRALRDFEMRGLFAMALVFPLYLCVPVVAEPRPFVPRGPLGALLVLERALDTPAEAFPSFHVVWACIAAGALADGRSARARVAAWCWAALVAASCWATGMHTLADVAAGWGAFALVRWAAPLWDAIRRRAERIANSWREWRFGGVRVIHHGLYAAAGTFVALVIVGALVGPGHAAAIALSAMGGLVVSALWAQFVEGSAVLMRPYGFYGGVLGIVLGALVAPRFGTDTWLLLGAYCVAGPWVQSAGRLRCLVQGCCHGFPAPEHIGIRYEHPRSRVCHIAHLKGVPLHPTPVYSILWNVVVAMAMARLWTLHVPPHFVAGIYLLLTGVGRFVEESFRGESQTPIYARLRLYQWIAIGTALAGAVITSVASSASRGPVALDFASTITALVVAMITGAALGIDFPASNRRFSRLA